MPSGLTCRACGLPVLPFGGEAVCMCRPSAEELRDQARHNEAHGEPLELDLDGDDDGA